LTGDPVGLVAEYRKSLKAIEVEEVLDLVFFRPLAFAFVKAVYRTRLTPNAVTGIATLVGLAAAVWMGTGSAPALIIAALLLIAYNVLDCSDGMLARLQGSGSRIGRILDGVADYIVTVAFYWGIGFGYATHAQAPVFAWALTAAAGFSNAFHSGLVDFYRNRFLDNLLKRVSVLEDDLDEFREEYDEIRRQGGRHAERLILWVYLKYSAVQRRLASRPEHAQEPSKIPGEVYVQANRGLMRWWTFLGPTTELSLLILGCLAGRIEIFLWAIVVGGNALAIVLKVLQSRSDRKLEAGLPS
jgi:hypothetical protein